jgi:AICAR transformylase/IMP cyclohydrolase PurH
VSDVQPTEQQLADLRFAWRIVKHVKSNAIAVAKDGRLLGMGSGQPNRVKSTEIALEKADADAKVPCLILLTLVHAAGCPTKPLQYNILVVGWQGHQP